MSDVTYPLLKSVTGHDGTRVFEWPHVDASYARVFYKPMPEQPGFMFYVVKITSHRSGDEGKWASDETEVDTIVHGNAYFDGIRHAHFGDEGYIYYLNCSLMSGVMLALRELEKKYCDPTQI